MTRRQDRNYALSKARRTAAVRAYYLEKRQRDAAYRGDPIPATANEFQVGDEVACRLRGVVASVDQDAAGDWRVVIKIGDEAEVRLDRVPGMVAVRVRQHRV
jgi:hypothetical protein